MADSNRFRLLTTVLLATALFSAMGGPALAPALPAIRAAYADVHQIEFWTKMLIAVSGLFSAVGAPLFGWISDRYGRRRALNLALAGWGVFGSLGLLPQPFWALLAGRAALGLCLGGLLAANTAMISASFNRDQGRRMMGMQSSFASIGTIVALIVSGWLADLHWRLVFSLFLAGFLVLPFGLFCPEPGKPAPARSTPRTDSFSLGLSLLYLFGFTGMLAFTIIPTQLPFFLKHHDLESASHIGLILAILPLSSAVAGRIYARLPAAAQPWRLFLFVGALMLAGFAALALATSPIGLVAGLIIIGGVFGLVMPHINVVLSFLVTPDRRGRAFGILTSCKFIGLSASPIVLQPLLTAYGYHGMLLRAGWLIAAVAALVWAVGTLLPGTRSAGSV